MSFGKKIEKFGWYCDFCPGDGSETSADGKSFFIVYQYRLRILEDALFLNDQLSDDERN